MIISKKKYNELLNLAFFDQATGFRNRNWFEKHFIQNIPQGKINLAIVDINNLKTINNNHGHHIGDEHIKQIGTLLSKYSLVVRWGSDEFFCIISDENKENFINLCKTQTDFAFAYRFGFDGKDIKETLVQIDQEMYDCKNKQKATK